MRVRLAHALALLALAAGGALSFFLFTANVVAARASMLSAVFSKANDHPIGTLVDTDPLQTPTTLPVVLVVRPGHLFQLR